MVRLGLAALRKFDPTCEPTTNESLLLLLPLLLMMLLSLITRHLTLGYIVKSKPVVAGRNEHKVIDCVYGTNNRLE